MTTFIDKLKEADEVYQRGMRYLEETRLRDLKRFLLSDKKRFMVAQALVPYQVVGSIKISFDTLETKLKSKYANDLRYLTWDQCANVVKNSKMITKLPGLMILDYDKLKVGAGDLKLLRKITERMALNKNTKIIISISPNTEGLCNLLKGLEDNSYFDYNYSRTKVDLHPPHRDQKQLIEAATLGDCDEENMLIASGQNVDMQDSEGNTALHKAVQKGHSEVVQILLDRVNFRSNKRGVTPLRFIYKIYINEKNHLGETALHKAAANGQSVIVQVLLDHGANFLSNKEGDTPLHLAARKGHTEVVGILLARNANVNEINRWNETPLHEAAKSGHREIVQVLLDHGAKFLPNKYGRTPLHLAASKGHIELVGTFLARNANVNEIKSCNRTPLHEAVWGGHNKIVQVLLDHGANFLSDKKGDTPLHLAALKGHTETVDILLARNVNVNEININGETPLHYATMCGHNNVTSMLIEYGANINTQCNGGSSPLHWAVRNQRTEVVQTLLDYRAKADSVDKSGRAALHYAAERGFMDIVRILINYGANCGLKCMEGTPAELAAMRFPEVAKYINHRMSSWRSVV